MKIEESWRPGEVRYSLQPLKNDTVIGPVVLVRPSAVKIVSQAGAIGFAETVPAMAAGENEINLVALVEQ